MSAHAKQKLSMMMGRVLLSPGDLVCDAAGIERGSDHRMILRMFLNTLIWAAVSVGVALVVTTYAGL